MSTAMCYQSVRKSETAIKECRTVVRQKIDALVVQGVSREELESLMASAAHFGGHVAVRDVWQDGLLTSEDFYTWLTT